MRLQSLHVPRCVFEVSDLECVFGVEAVEESLEEVPESAMMVLLPRQVHLQKDVAAVGRALVWRSAREALVCEVGLQAANVNDTREKKASKIGSNRVERAILAGLSSH